MEILLPVCSFTFGGSKMILGFYQTSDKIKKVAPQTSAESGVDLKNDRLIIDNFIIETANTLKADQS